MHQVRQHHQQKQRGFTMLELITVGAAVIILLLLLFLLS